MFDCKLISRKGLQMDAFRSTSFRVGLPQRVSSFLSNFIVCKSWNPCRKLSMTSTSENYSPYAQRVLSLTRFDACAVDPGRRFLTEGGEKKESRNLNPGLSAWVITILTRNGDQYTTNIVDDSLESTKFS